MKSEIIKAWMAGFVDGEGCISISKQVRKNRPTPQWRPYIAIANTNRDSLVIFQKHYGGTLRFNAEKRASKSGVKWSDSWTWYCRQSSIKIFCEELLPFFVVKKKQAGIMLTFLNHVLLTKRSKGGREKNGTFKGSEPLRKKDIRFRDMVKNKIQSLNSGNRFKIAA